MEYLSNTTFSGVRNDVVRSFEWNLLALAYSLRNSEKSEAKEIVKQYPQKYYDLLEIYHKLKAIDRLSEREIIEKIKRKESKIYGIVVEYYPYLNHLLTDDGLWSDPETDTLILTTIRGKLDHILAKYAIQEGWDLLIFELVRALRARSRGS